MALYHCAHDEAGEKTCAECVAYQLGFENAERLIVGPLDTTATYLRDRLDEKTADEVKTAS